MGVARADDQPSALLADVIREHRHRAGLTQQELAGKAGLSLAALRDLEQGRRSRPRPGSLAALAGALSLDACQAADLASRAGQTRDGQARAGSASPLSTPPPSQGLCLAVLGPVEAWRDGRPLPLGPERRRAVLGLLALEPGAVVRRESIMDVLWGAAVPDTASNLVQGHISRLRKLLAPRGSRSSADKEVIASTAGGYRLQLPSDQLDVLTFRKLSAQADAARLEGDELAACDLYEQSLQLWRGDPLADVDGLHEQLGVTRTRRQLANVLLRYADLACSLGFHDRVLNRLYALAAAEPLNERVHARLMIALAGVGQQAAAVRVFENLRRRLDHEFAIYPGEELADAHVRVLRQDIAVGSASYEPPRPGTSPDEPASAGHCPMCGSPLHLSRVAW